MILVWYVCLGEGHIMWYLQCYLRTEAASMGREVQTSGNSHPPTSTYPPHCGCYSSYLMLLGSCCSTTSRQYAISVLTIQLISTDIYIDVSQYYQPTLLSTAYCVNAVVCGIRHSVVYQYRMKYVNSASW